MMALEWRHRARVRGYAQVVFSWVRSVSVVYWVLLLDGRVLFVACEAYYSWYLRVSCFILNTFFFGECSCSNANFSVLQVLYSSRSRILAPRPLVRVMDGAGRPFHLGRNAMRYKRQYYKYSSSSKTPSEISEDLLTVCC